MENDLTFAEETFPRRLSNEINQMPGERIFLLTASGPRHSTFSA